MLPACSSFFTAPLLVIIDDFHNRESALRRLCEDSDKAKLRNRTGHEFRSSRGG